jgi:hypothetical protein
MDRTVRPAISGPATWPVNGPPPQFTVDAAGMPLYMVELASARCLMMSIVDRTVDNYFYGGDAESVFATGAGWCVPRKVWAHLRLAYALYYRVVAFDQSAGASELSVDDEHLDTLPVLLVVQSAGRLRRDARR